MSDNISPFLSVLVITYNHENYIANALDSILSQKFEYPFEIVVGNDSSNDRTGEIINTYQLNHPDIFKVLPRKQNIGMMPNFVNTLNNCRGKYIAICEGDDYWTDSFKLRKQVEILENNPEYSMCFHNAKVITPNDAYLFIDKKVCNPITIQNLISHWCIPSASLVFRNNIIPIPRWFESFVAGDYPLEILLASKGPAYYLNEVMSVYRKLPSGSDSSSDSLNRFMGMIKYMNGLDEYLNFQYTEDFHNAIYRYSEEIKRIQRFRRWPLLKLLDHRYLSAKAARLFKIH